MDPVQKGAFLTTLARDAAGNTLAIATASIFAIMGVVGGAVDISRSYMAQSRLQQACDAGALAARKAMTGESLTEANKQTGYQYFDFNFPEDSYGVELTSRTYSQPANTAGTPQAIVDGTVIATVPTTIMRIFGKETVDLVVSCSSKMDIQNADVAMVLDVTGSMDGDMDVTADGSQTESRLSALRKAVRAFYNALGPGRAGGDLSKGRIRYAFIPYGTVVNVGTLLTHDQMVDSWTYQSREVKNANAYAWTLGATAPVNNYGNPTPSGPPDSFSADTAYNTFSVVNAANSAQYTMQSGQIFTRRTTAVSTSTACTNLNQYGTAHKLVGVQQAADASWPTATTTVTTNSIPVYPAAAQDISASQTRTQTVTLGYRYKWSTQNNTPGCYLEVASKKTNNNGDKYTQTRTGTTTRPIIWETIPGVQPVYSPRAITVSGLKGSNGTWNTTISVPALNRSGSTSTYNRTWSGYATAADKKIGGTAQAANVTWRGCVEERQIDNTITAATPVSTVPTNAYDLDVTRMASTGNDNTRWKPYLYQVVFAPATDIVNPVTNSEECPSPALRLQEIGDYDKTLLTISPTYANTLFRATSGSPTSYYYPYQSTAWPDPDPVNHPTPVAERSKNLATIRNYIDRIQTVSGTLHDAGFAWGLHLVSGEGMFAADNPDRFNTAVVSRHIVFMTDGEMNPGEERYVFSGFNQQDGRLAPRATSNAQMIGIENRRLRILCEAAKAQKITVWVVAITDSTTTDYTDLRECASAPGNFKTAATSTELINSFTTIAQSIGGLRISR
jgi:Flp pilus assembly protein TadG